MANLSISKRIFALSPHIEMFARRLYWKNIEAFTNHSARKVKPEVKPEVKSVAEPVDFNKIIDFLAQSGVEEGSLLLVHSAYEALKASKKRPNQILESLFELIGEKGTLAMPSMPKFKNDGIVTEYLTRDISQEVFEYDVQKSKVKTGALPGFLTKRPNSVRSRHPINTMVAEGPLAALLMEDNLAGESPLACGDQSSWKRCVDHNAVIVGLGTDLTHSLTMIHVAEDVLDADWPIKSWYRDKYFLIKDGEFEERRTLRERQPVWGALHYGERTLCKDLIKNNILISTTIDGVLVEVLHAQALLSFLNSKNKSGYPYFWV